MSVAARADNSLVQTNDQFAQCFAEKVHGELLISRRAVRVFHGGLQILAGQS